MAWNSPSRRKRAWNLSDRQGLTLIEMLLVMALMVMIASISAPAFRRPMENYRLRKAGDVIRVAFTRARIRAMKSGQTHMFRYQMGGNGYVIELWQADDAYLEAGTEVDVDQTLPLPAGSNRSSSGNVQDGGGTDFDIFLPGIQEELPEGCSFLGGLIEADIRGAMLQQEMGGSLVQTDWSPPILFYPDGTTSDAKVVLANRNLVYVRVDLRGLTGIAIATGLMDLEELELPQ